MGTMPGEKGVHTSNHISKRGQFQEQNDQHIQKQGMKRFRHPKGTIRGQEMVSTAKNGAGRGSCVQKGTISGKKWSACPKRGQKGVRMSKKGQKGTTRGRKGLARPKTGQARVRVSKKGRFRARRGWHVQKWGRKGFVCPKRGDFGREMSGASKNGAGRGPYVPKRDSSGQEGVGASKKGRFRARKGRRVQIEQGQVQRRTVAGKKGSVSPKTGQEGVST